VSESDAADVVRAFIDAFNSENLDALAATLADDVAIQASRGLVEGREEARKWATRNPTGELHQRLILDGLDEEGAHVIATVRRQWYWSEDGETADEQEIFYLATMRDGLIARWVPFEEHDEALRAAGAGD